METPSSRETLPAVSLQWPQGCRRSIISVADNELQIKRKRGWPKQAQDAGKVQEIYSLGVETFLGKHTAKVCFKRESFQSGRLTRE
jgi:hypothetical protein